MRRIVAALPRVHNGRPGRLLRSETFPLVLDVAEADRLSSGASLKPIHKMRASYQARKQEEKARRGR